MTYLSEKHRAELERLLGRFIAIQNEPAPPAICKACGKEWSGLLCCEVPEVHTQPDTRFARQLELVPSALAVVSEAHEVASREEQQRYLCTVAASLLPWDQAGDEAAAALAVRAARQLLDAARRDTEPLGSGN